MLRFESETDGNLAATAPLDMEGNYNVADIPNGKMRVRINVPPRHLRNFLTSGEANEVAAKYNHAGGPSLKVEVHPGSNQFNSDLE
jgi:hypothetical protein